MKTLIDLADQEWTLRGYWPQSWEWGYSMETGSRIVPEIGPLPAKVPGSVQSALLDAGIIPDWNTGLNSRSCEWVENRAWIFKTEIQLGREATSKISLHLEGLDGNGFILANGRKKACFDNSFIPYSFELDIEKKEESQKLVLEIVFEPPPRWLGQICRTSQIKDWKPRFNYSWDWTARLVQTGIWDKVWLEINDGAHFEEIKCASSYDHKSGLGQLELSAEISGAEETLAVNISVIEEESGSIIATEKVNAGNFRQGIVLSGLPVKAWWPNGAGEQFLYNIRLELRDGNGNTLENILRRIGFRNIEWHSCKNAPAEADPWLCEINGKPVFLQGINWTPIKPDFADVPDSDYEQFLSIYKDMGCNLLRVWGGAFLEKEIFYDLCDRKGLMIWQEFPFSSSAIDNWPPEDNKVIEEAGQIAGSYIKRRKHHASLIIWCGGNELQGSLDGSKTGTGKPVDDSHPLIKRLKETVASLDPERRFLPTSSSGPRFLADKKDFGKNLHWDVHGPWKVVDNELEKHKEYWENDDALFRSEAGAPGTSDITTILKYTENTEDIFPPSLENPLWRRTSWWFDWAYFENAEKSKPSTLHEYIKWSQDRQARALGIAALSSKKRFPETGGFIVWMGHDSFPCICNTSLIDFGRNLKPAFFTLQSIFRAEPDSLKDFELNSAIDKTGFRI